MLLTAGNDSIQIDPSKGGRVVGFVVSGLDLIVGEDPDALDWGCYPMVPWAGRIRNGHFAWGDVDVTLPIRMPPHAIHGTVFDRSWQESGPQQLESTLGDQWPWQATVRSRFSMEPECFHWEITVSSEDKLMPVVLGWHPWFRKRLADGSHTTLHFNADEMYLRGADGIPSGAKSSPSKGPWDDCFTGVSVPPQIRWSNGLCLEVSTRSCTLRLLGGLRRTRPCPLRRASIRPARWLQPRPLRGRTARFSAHPHDDMAVVAGMTGPACHDGTLNPTPCSKSLRSYLPNRRRSAQVGSNCERGRRGCSGKHTPPLWV